MLQLYRRFLTQRNPNMEIKLFLSSSIKIKIILHHTQAYSVRTSQGTQRVSIIKITYEYLIFKACWLRDTPTSLTFNNRTLCPLCIDAFCIYLRSNSDLCPTQHKLIGFYNQDEKCLLRYKNWFFK